MSTYPPLSLLPRARVRTAHWPLDHVLISNLTRIQSLSLSNPSPCWLEQLGELTSILNLSIDWPDSVSIPRNRLPILHPHSFTRVSSDETSTKNIGRLIPVSTTLTILELTSVRVDVCIKIMLGCPNLVEAYIHDPLDPLDEDDDEEELQEMRVSQPVIFSHLTVFLWTDVDCIWRFASTFDQMKTPRLHTFIISGPDGEIYLDTMKILIQQFPDTLQTVQFQNLYFVSITDCALLLHTNSFVEHVILYKCDMDLAEKVFYTLRVVDETSGLDHLPRINALTLRDCYYDPYPTRCELDTEQFDKPFDQLFESWERRLNQGDRFRLDLIGFDIDWNPSTHERLMKLVERGVQLEVFKDENPVEWL